MEYNIILGVASFLVTFLVYTGISKFRNRPVKVDLIARPSELRRQQREIEAARKREAEEREAKIKEEQDKYTDEAIRFVNTVIAPKMATSESGQSFIGDKYKEINNRPLLNRIGRLLHEHGYYVVLKENIYCNCDYLYVSVATGSRNGDFKTI